MPPKKTSSESKVKSRSQSYGEKKSSSTSNSKARSKIESNHSESDESQTEASESTKIHQEWSEEIFTLHSYFQEILQGDPPYRYICKKCSENSLEGISKGFREGLRRHLESARHLNYTSDDEMNSLAECINICGGDFKAPSNKIKKVSKGPSGEKPLSDEQELQFYFTIAEFMIKKHIPFSVTEDLIELLKTISTQVDIRVIERANLSSTTMNKLVKTCIAAELKEKIFAGLEISPFSIILDETSSIYGGSYLGLHVRYIEQKQTPTTKQKKVTLQTKFLAVIKLDSTSAGGDLYKKVKEELFIQKPLLESNCIALCTDNASKIIESGDLNLYSRLKADIPNLIHIRDFCHLYNLIAEDALGALPKFLFHFIKQISSHFSSSAHRRAKLEEIQAQLGLKTRLQVLRVVETRWSSLLECAERILELWEVLEYYFKKTTDSVLVESFNPEYNLLTQVLCCLLGTLDHYIKYFQTEDMYYNRVFLKMKEGYTTFCQMLLKPSYSSDDFEKLYAISFSNPQEKSQYLMSDEEFKINFLQMYSYFQKIIEKARLNHPGIEKEMFSMVREFYLKAIASMKKRLPFNNKTLNLSQIIYLNDTCEIETWRQMSLELSNVITEKVRPKFEEELRRFKFQYKNIKSEVNEFNKNYAALWQYLSHDYPHMGKLAFALMVLPYSSAMVESTFSKLKAYKTPYRNKLSAETLEACLLIEQEDQTGNLFSITQELKAKYISMWKIEAKREQGLTQTDLKPHSNHNEPVSSHKIRDSAENLKDRSVNFGKRRFPNNLMPEKTKHVLTIEKVNSILSHNGKIEINVPQQVDQREQENGQNA